MRPKVKRLLLLQTVHEETRRHHNTEVFPFLLGMFRALGWSAEWLVVHVPREHMHRGARYVFDLPGTILPLLEQEFSGSPPDVVVCADRPTSALELFLRRCSPGVRIVDLTARVDAMPEFRSDIEMTGVTLVSTAATNAVIAYVTGDNEAGMALVSDPAARFLDEAPLSYQQRTIGPRVFRQPPVRLVSDRQCPYQRPVRSNPLFRGVPSDAVQRQSGCSFCRPVRFLPLADLWPHRDQVDFALRQIEAHQRDAGQDDQSLEYLWETGSLNRELADFLRELSSHSLRPSTFYFMARADELLALRAVLEDVLPRFAASGHRMAPMSIGAENFSPGENERLNKGISTRQLWSCFDMIRELEGSFPMAFRCEDWGYFSGILFTPWTRPEDLLDNVQAAERLGPAWLQRMVGSRLQLWDGCAITDLAIHDGLAGRDLRVTSEISAICQRDPDDSEIPWRFADPKLESIVRILVRLEPVPSQVQLPEDDPLRREIADLRSGLPGGGSDYVALVRSVVQAVSSLGAQAGVVDLFRHVASKWPVAEAACVLPESTDGEPERLPPPPLGLRVRAQRGEGVDSQVIFQIQRHEPGMNLYRRVGTLALSYQGRDLPAEMADFGKALEVAMKGNQHGSLVADDAAVWRAAIAAALNAAGLDGKYVWKFESD